MRLIYNTLVLLLATTVLAAPLPSTSNDALTDGNSTGEHTLAHHHHVHHSKHAKHAKHVAHSDESELAARSLFDELEERSFYDEGYSQLERRTKGQDKGKGKARPNLKIVTSAVSKLLKGKNKAPNTPSPKHSIDHSTHVGSPVSSNHGHITPFTGHQAGPSNHGASSKAAEAHRNKPLPPLPGSPHRSNSLPPSAGSHRDAPPPYSLHVANPGSSTSGSIRQPHRSMTTGSSVSLAGTHGSSDRFSIDSPHSASSVAGSSPRSSKRGLKDTYQSVKKVVKKPYDVVRSSTSQAIKPYHGVQDYTSKGGKQRAAKASDNKGNPNHITPFRG